MLTDTKDSHSLNMIFLGSGSAFTIGEDNYHSNILLSRNQKTLLIDCGGDIRFSLYEQGLDCDDIDNVYISHLHADHVGGLEWLGFNRKFFSKKPKPVLYLSKLLVNKLWSRVLAGSMSSMKDEKSTLDSFFEVKSINSENSFDWQGINFKLIKTHHYFNNNKLSPSFGLFITFHKNKIFLTTDTMFCEDLYHEYYLDADVIFQDCETMSTKSGVHAHYDQLCTLDKKIKAKMWLYHYNHGKKPDAIKDGFKGFVLKGQKFDFD